ncbi:MAG: hypothetical protein H6969_10645 [Gammaproteobacteria bacterium]|nr:hypothetical protein [Gammaproteobacteria bacterium]
MDEAKWNWEDDRLVCQSVLYRWLLRLLLSVMITVFGIVTARAATDTALDFRIGAASPVLPGVKLFAAPRSGMHYHVLSGDGATRYAGEVRKQVEDDPCTGERQNAWYIRPADPDYLKGLDAAVIVVGANGPIDLLPITDTRPSAGIRVKLAEHVQNLTKDGPNRPVEQTVRDMGRNAQTQRVAVVLTEINADSVGGFDKVRVLVLDLLGQRWVERQTYSVESGESGELTERIAAVADIDQDGLGDVVLIDFGDFYAKVLLIEESAQWRVQTDDWGDPC